jgi:hypothetical protein
MFRSNSLEIYLGVMQHIFAYQQTYLQASIRAHTTAVFFKDKEKAAVRMICAIDHPVQNWLAGKFAGESNSHSNHREVLRRFTQ